MALKRLENLDAPSMDEGKLEQKGDHEQQRYQLEDDEADRERCGGHCGYGGIHLH